MTEHPHFHDAEKVGLAATRLIVALPNGGFILCDPWYKAEKPGDVGGVSKFSAPVYMGQNIYPTLETAQDAWRKRANLEA